jgi:hypothetical protein
MRFALAQRPEPSMRAWNLCCACASLQVAASAPFMSTECVALPSAACATGRRLIWNRSRHLADAVSTAEDKQQHFVMASSPVSPHPCGSAIEALRAASHSTWQRQCRHLLFILGHPQHLLAPLTYACVISPATHAPAHGEGGPAPFCVQIASVINCLPPAARFAGGVHCISTRYLLLITRVAPEQTLVHDGRKFRNLPCAGVRVTFACCSRGITAAYSIVHASQSPLHPARSSLPDARRCVDMMSPQSMSQTAEV